MTLSTQEISDRLESAGPGNTVDQMVEFLPRAL
jgi:hypothetical protein